MFVRRGAAVNSEPVIQVNDLKKSYSSGLFRRRRINALQGATLEVPRGSIYGLLGPNGAGKTTMIKILLGIVRKSSGEAKVLGQQAGALKTRERIGYLPENHRIPRHLTGATALEYFGGLSGLSAAEARRRSPALLEVVGLRGREKERVSGYSKGMQQRLGLAQALLHEPELIILDEPTDGVDPVGRKDIREVLMRLAEGGTTVFLNSHLLQEIELVCESVAILSQGQVRKNGLVADIIDEVADAALQYHLSGQEEHIQSALGVDARMEVQQDGTWYAQVAVTEKSAGDRIIDELRSNGVSILAISRKQLSLEDAFLKIIDPAQSA